MYSTLDVCKPAAIACGGAWTADRLAVQYRFFHPALNGAHHLGAQPPL